MATPDDKYLEFELAAMHTPKRYQNDFMATNWQQQGPQIACVGNSGFGCRRDAQKYRAILFLVAGAIKNWVACLHTA